MPRFVQNAKKAFVEEVLGIPGGDAHIAGADADAEGMGHGVQPPTHQIVSQSGSGSFTEKLLPIKRVIPIQDAGPGLVRRRHHGLNKGH